MKLNVLSPVEHDGVTYTEGMPMEIKDDAQARALIAAGVADEVVKKSKAETAKA